MQKDMRLLMIVRTGPGRVGMLLLHVAVQLVARRVESGPAVYTGTTHSPGRVHALRQAWYARRRTERIRVALNSVY